MTGALGLCLKDKFYLEGTGLVTQFTGLMQFLILLGFHDESDIWLSQCISGYNWLVY